MLDRWRKILTAMTRYTLHFRQLLMIKFTHLIMYGELLHDINLKGIRFIDCFSGNMKKFLTKPSGETVGFSLTASGNNLVLGSHKTQVPSNPCRQLMCMITLSLICVTLIHCVTVMKGTMPPRRCIVEWWRFDSHHLPRVVYSDHISGVQWLIIIIISIISPTAENAETKLGHVSVV